MLALALWLLATFFGPNCDRLGSDCFATREWESKRCDNLLAVLLLPKTHDSPEVCARMQALRSKHLRLLNQEFCERAVIRRDAGMWARLYLATGKSVIARTYDGAFTELFGQTERCQSLFQALPVPNRGGEEFLRRPPFATDFGRWLEYADYYAGVPPAPRPAVP